MWKISTEIQQPLTRLLKLKRDESDSQTFTKEMKLEHCRVVDIKSFRKWSH